MTVGTDKIAEGQFLFQLLKGQMGQCSSWQLGGSPLSMVEVKGLETVEVIKSTIQAPATQLENGPTLSIVCLVSRCQEDSVGVSGHIAGSSPLITGLGLIRVESTPLGCRSFSSHHFILPKIGPAGAAAFQLAVRYWP